MLLLTLGLAQATKLPSERPVALGVGAFFNAGGTFMTQPRDRTYPGLSGELPFSGWAGFSPGGGMVFDFRAKDAVGLEVGLIRSKDHAESKYGINGTDVFFAVDQPAWHIPIVLKGSIPSDKVSPMLFVGWHLVLPGEPDLPQPTALPWAISATSGSYDLWTFGVGLEAKLPIEDVDLRIPFQLRGSVNTPYPKAATERATYDISPGGVLNGMEYTLEWEYHAAITLGLSWYFL